MPLPTRAEQRGLLVLLILVVVFVIIRVIWRLP